MLGLIFIYWVGRAFYELAHEHEKSRWGFAILGVVSYYAGLFLGAIGVGIIAELISPGFVENTSDIALGFMAIPFGALTCWITYVLLKRSWSKARSVTGQTLDSGLMSTKSEQ